MFIYIYIYIYIHRRGHNWIKLINYIDDVLYTSNSEETRLKFESKLKRKFNLTLIGPAKCYLGMRIKHYKEYPIDQEQYVKKSQEDLRKSSNILLS